MTLSGVTTRTNLTKAPRAGGPAFTVVPFACCLCGRPDLRCLCRPCRLAHTDPSTGTLAPWLHALQRLGQARSARVKRNSRHPHGAIRLVSLDALTDPPRS